MKNVDRLLETQSRRSFEQKSAEAARRLALAASDEGLLDVAYATVDSPIGRLIAAVTKRGLVRLAYAGEGLDGVLEDIAWRVSPRVMEAPSKLDRVRRELDEYFEKKRTKFEVPVDLALSAGFYRRVLAATASIPFGKVATYKDVAEKAGNPRATRAAGNALGSNPVAIVVPCHRVVRTGGDLGGYGGGLDRKRFLLTLEGALS